MNDSAFVDWFHGVLKKAFPDLRTTEIPIPEVQKTLSLTSVINRETLRQLVKSRKPVSKAIEDRIMSQLAKFDLEKVPKVATGFETRKIIQDWYSEASPDTDVYLDDETSQAHLILESRLDERKILIICVDDDLSGDNATHPYLQPFIADADERIRCGAVSSAILITRRRPMAALRDAQGNVVDGLQRTWTVKISTLNEFIGKRMRVGQAARLVEDRLVNDNVTEAKDLLPIPYSTDDHEEGYNKTGDALAELMRLCKGGAGGAMAILGSYGTGKSVLLWMAARRLLQEHQNAITQAALPIIIDAKTLGDGYGDVLLNQISGALIKWYGYSPPPDVIKLLIQAGHIVLLVDALDESAAMRNVRHVKHLLGRFLEITAQNGDGHSHAVVVVTSRVELFDDHAQEVEATTGLGFQRLKLRHLAPAESKQWLDRRLRATNPGLLRQLADQAELTRAVDELIRTPLFLRIVEDVVSRAPLLDHVNHRTIISDIYRQFTDKWLAREQPKAAAKGFPIQTRVRERFCQQLAALIRGPEFRNQMIDAAVIRALVLDHYTTVEQHPRDVVISQLDDLEFDAKHSSFLVRDDATNRFRFSHDSFTDYFLALAIEEALNTTWPEMPVPVTDSHEGAFNQLRKWDDEMQRGLRLNAVLYREPFSHEKPLVHHFLHGLLDRPVGTTVDFMDRHMKTDRKTLGRLLSENQLSIWHFNLLYLRVAMALCENTLPGRISFESAYLAAAELTQLPTRVPDGGPNIFHGVSNFILDNSNLELATISKEDDNGDHIKGKNVLGPYGKAGDNYLADLPSHGGGRVHLPERVVAIAKYCVASGLLTEADLKIDGNGQMVGDLDKPLVDSRGFQWCIIPGGIYKQRITRVGGATDTDGERQRYNEYMAKSFQTGALIEGDAAPNFGIEAYSGPVALSSFLLQRHPVTNEQYLAFLRDNKNKRWRRAAPAEPTLDRTARDRNVLGNAYYLGGWDGLLEEFGEDLYNKNMNELRGKIDKRFPHWRHSPVVYIGHHHAEAFARFYGLDLPTRAQAEAGARLYQADPFWSFESDPQKCLPETPWCGSDHREPAPTDCTRSNCTKAVCDTNCHLSWKGYAFAKSRGDSGEAFPYFDCTEILGTPVEFYEEYKSGGKNQKIKIDLSGFHAWREQQFFPANVPLHLLGCVSEWLRDVYDVNSAIGFHHRSAPGGTQAIPLNPYNDGLWLEWIEGGAGQSWQARKRGPYPNLKRYAVREGSFRQPGDEYCKISKIADITATSMNPDFGFRCIKRLWSVKE